MLDKQHIMVDFETLGLGHNAVLLSIGAVRFRPYLGTIEDTFYQVIDVQSCVDAGMTVDASTALWWMDQSDAARSAITDPHALAKRYAEDDDYEPEPGTMVAMPLHLTMAGFNHYLRMNAEGKTPDTVIWTSARKDFDWLENAYAKSGMRKPYTYKAEFDYRTLRNVFPQVTHDWEGTTHNALDDAINQALHLSKIMRHVANMQAATEKAFTMQELQVGVDDGLQPDRFERLLTQFVQVRKDRLEL